MRNLNQIFCFFVTLLFFCGCGSCNPKKVSSTTAGNSDSLKTNIDAIAKDDCVPEIDPNNRNLNISILLDLSDRIDPNTHPNATMPYDKRDLGFISAIAKAFQCHCLRKRLNVMNDRMQVYFNPIPDNTEINSLSEKLKIKVDKTITIDKLNDISAVYQQTGAKLYANAIKDNKFIGSDIWDFFSNKISAYNIVKPEYKNVLVILTDGYMLYMPSKISNGGESNFISSKRNQDLGLNTNDWEKKMNSNNIRLTPASNSLTNLRVLLIGINPEGSNVYEKLVLRKYWSDWFNAMGIDKNNYQILDNDLPSNLEETIENFILKS